MKMVTFYLIIFIILLWSGWFHDLPTQLGIRRNILLVITLVLICCSTIPDISITSTIQFSVLFVLLFIVNLWILRSLPNEQRLSMLLKSTSGAAVLIGFHELFAVQMDWQSFPFAFIVALLVLLNANLFFADLRQKIVYQWWTLFMFYFVVLVIYRDRLNPIYIGDETFLVSGFLLSGCLLLTHFLLEHVRTVAQRLRNR